MSVGDMYLVKPHRELVWSYREALERGWSPNTLVNKSKEALEHLLENEREHLASHDGLPPWPLKLGDGSTVPQLPMIGRWLWDGAFCGFIRMRYQPGRQDVPPYVLGNIGYTVVPWKQGLGYATRALLLMMAEARLLKLRQLVVVCTPENMASRRVLEKCGGVLVEERVFPEYDPGVRCRYVLPL